MARFPALPPPAQVVTTQPIEQSGNNLKNLRGARPQWERPQFDPIPMTYTKLYPKLIQGGMLVPVSIPPIRPPYPRWYNENASCDYHFSNMGYSLEDCTALKWKVSEFIKKGELTFEDEDIPNVNGNPLPNHEGSKVNAVEDSPDLQVTRDVKNVRMPMRLVHEALVKAGRLKDKQEKKEEEMSQEKAYCQYHDKVMGHSIQECPEFLKMV